MDKEKALIDVRLLIGTGGDSDEIVSDVYWNTIASTKEKIELLDKVITAQIRYLAAIAVLRDALKEE